MLVLKYKDKKKRIAFKRLEKTLLISKFILKKNLPVLKLKQQKKFVKFYCKIKKKISRFSRNKIVNRCVMTNRPRGVNKQFKLCRHKLREYFLFGLIPGYKKLIW